MRRSRPTRPRRAKQLKISSPPWKPPTATSLPVRTRARDLAARARPAALDAARGRPLERRRSTEAAAGLDAAREEAWKALAATHEERAAALAAARKEAALAARKRTARAGGAARGGAARAADRRGPARPIAGTRTRAASPTESEGYFDAHGYEAPPTDSPVRYVEAAVRAPDVARAITRQSPTCSGAPTRPALLIL